MKEFRYIIRRIIVGVGIALLLMFIKGNLLMKVDALVYGNSTSGTTLNLGNTLSDVDFTLPSPIFNGLGGGTLTFNIGLQKQGASGTQSTSPVVVPRSIFVSNGVANYPCFTGSYSSQNSTWDGSYISVQCPFDANLNGLVSIHIRFSTSYASGNESNYLLTIGGPISFQTELNTQVNVDTSSTNSTINNQTQSIINNQNSNTQSIINNQNQNNQSLINNQNQNTQSIINNQNQQTQDLIGGKCQESSSLFNFDLTGKIFNQTTGVLEDNSSWTSTSEFYTGIDKIIIVTQNSSTQALRINTYDSNKNYISTTPYTGGQEIVLNKKYFYKFSRRSPTLSSYTVYVCTSGLSDINSGISDINSSINNDNVDGASSEASSFFDDFQSDSHGLSGVITAPFRLINSLTTASCSPLQFQLPFTHDSVSLPCMRSIYENYFGVFFSLYQLITTGLISYLVMINLYSKIHNLQNPNNDRIEVLNL